MTVAALRRPNARLLAVAMMAATVAALPPFLVGSLAVQLRRDLDFDAAGLGLAVSAFWLSSALSSAALGRAAERLGAARAVRLGLTGNLALQLAVAAFARSWSMLVVLLFVGGVLNSLIQLAVNVLLSQQMPAHRLGLALGAKQSAIPMGTLLGGLAVPAIALTVGWEWAFVAAGALALLALAALPSSRGRAAPAERPAALSSQALTSLVVLGSGAAFAAAAAGALAAFLVSGGVAEGLGEGAAGVLLTVGSATGIAVRLAAGVRADRRDGGHLRVVIGMLAIGALGIAGLGAGGTWTYVLLTPLAFGSGWAWPGLFNLAVVRDHPDRPGAATGVTQTGVYVGALLGPLAFGLVVEHGSYSTAWVLAGTWLIVAAGIVWYGRRLSRARARR
ncbi:MAG TPA: MFS transporter [Acidimicrobiales bacterium]|nr:MFS transporter [Acidimicrobiales bacterium]